MLCPISTYCCWSILGMLDNGHGSNLEWSHHIGIYNNIRETMHSVCSTLSTYTCLSSTIFVLLRLSFTIFCAILRNAEYIYRIYYNKMQHMWFICRICLKLAPIIPFGWLQGNGGIPFMRALVVSIRENKGSWNKPAHVHHVISCIIISSKLY